MPRSISRVVLVCVLAMGCQRGPTWELVPVEGTVSKDGRPLANIEVVFLLDMDASTGGPRSRGTTDEVGHYRLRTDNGDDGAVAGKYRVTLLDLEAAMKRGPRGVQQKETVQLPPDIAQRVQGQRKPAAEAPRLLPRYRRFNETPLRVEVRSGTQVIDFNVKASNVEVKFSGPPVK